MDMKIINKIKNEVLKSKFNMIGAGFAIGGLMGWMYLGQEGKPLNGFAKFVDAFSESE